MRLGDYELERELGEGGMATVWKARHVVLDTHHAVKVLNAKFRESPDVRKRFLDEAKIQAKHLDHPNIVKVTNIVSTPDAAALVMELIDGTSLDREIGRLKTDPADAKRIMLGILGGVGHAHGKGIIHRDLKPGNVLLAKRGTKLFPKVTDFGIAKVNTPDEAASPSKKKTAMDARMGTPAYMSPEQMRRARDVTPRSDIFSLGVMLYEMTTGVLPFDGDNDYDMMEAIVHGRYTPPLTRNPKLDPLIAQVIEKAIKAEPADRFASCEEMAAVLAGEKKLADVAKSSTPQPVRAPTPPPTDVAAKQATASTALTTPPATQNSSGSGRLIGFGLLALALAVGGLAIVFALKKDTPATTQNESGSAGPPAAGDVDPDGIPSDAKRMVSGVAYKWIVEPTFGAPTPRLGSWITISKVELAKDGTELGKPTNSLMKWTTGGFGELNSVIATMTKGSKLRVWYPANYNQRIVQFELTGDGTYDKDAVLKPLGTGSPAPPLAPPPPAPPAPAPGRPNGAGYCMAPPSRKGECDGIGHQMYSKWHFHAYVRKDGDCYACYDEEANTCDELKHLGISRINDSDCGGYPEGKVDPYLAGK